MKQLTRAGWFQWAASSYGLASAASLCLGVFPLMGLACDRCVGGALSAALPWIGGGIYAALGAVTWKRPGASFLGHAATFTFFIHADLLVESVELERACWGCMAVAAFSILAGAVRAGARPQERLPLAVGFLLGCAAAAFAPYDRADDALTRRLWPARHLAALPPVVDRDKVFRCDHADAEVRFLVYERDCKACGSATRLLLPALQAEFGPRVCVHVQEVAGFPPGVRLPVFVMATPNRRVLALEGGPSLGELREMVEALLTGRPFPPEAPDR